MILNSLIQAAASGLSRYEVAVAISNYSNPQQIRPLCNGRCFNTLFYCCDNDLGLQSDCPENMVESRCDIYFVYCLRSRLDTTPGLVQCPDTTEAMTSDVNQNDRPLNFSQSKVLGLDNPLIFQGLTENWTVSLSS